MVLSLASHQPVSTSQAADRGVRRMTAAPPARSYVGRAAQTGAALIKVKQGLALRACSSP